MPGPKQNDAWAGMGTGWAITATLVAGMAVCGALGYLVDLAVGTSKVFLGIGVVVGAGFGIYIIYLRWGRPDRDEG
jgi:F0F1-type ATP synthase assembly protein I